MTALAWILLATGCCAFALLTVKAWLERRGLALWMCWLAGLVAAPVGFIGGMVLGAPIDRPVPWWVGVFGAALMAPFVALWWRTREVRLVEQNPAAVPPVPPQFVPAPAPAVVALRHDEDDSPFAGEYQFNYEDASGDVDERVVHITHLSESKGRLYFEGWRTDTMEDRSYRVDRVVGMMVDTDTGAPYEADVLAALLGVPSTRDTAQFTPDLSAQFAPRAGWRTGVCFLGFGYAKEQELSELAEAADWKVLGDVSKHADYVVLNGRAGARQRQRAEDAGATVIDEDTFRAMV